jgi:hypothetical protein
VCGDAGDTLPPPALPIFKGLTRFLPMSPHLAVVANTSAYLKPPHVIPISAERSGRGSQPQNAKTRPQPGEKQKTKLVDHSLGPKSSPVLARLGREALGCAFVSNLLCGTGTPARGFSIGGPSCRLPTMLMWHSRPRLWPLPEQRYQTLQTKDESSVTMICRGSNTNLRIYSHLKFAFYSRQD